MPDITNHELQFTKKTPPPYENAIKNVFNSGRRKYFSSTEANAKRTTRGASQKPETKYIALGVAGE